MHLNLESDNDSNDLYGTPIASPQSLVNELSSYSMYDTLSRVSGLLTVPSLQSNTFRIENLIHLVANHCHGRKKPSYANLMKWLNTDLSGIAYYEDPAEDVFISNVSAPHGNFRLFEGIWESSSFYTQAFVDILCSQNTPDDFEKFKKQAINFLKLSELICKRLSLKRWTSEESLPQNEVNLPEHSEIVLRGKAITFTKEELISEGIEPNLLSPFISEDWSVYDCSKNAIGNSSLERYPLFKINEKYILSVPSAVNPAIRRYGLELIKELNLIDSFEFALRNYYVQKLDKDITHFKDLEPIDNIEAKDIAPQIENISIAVGRFDQNKTILFITVHDPVEEIIEQGLSSTYSPGEDYCNKISDYIDETCSYFKKQGFNGGTVVMNLCGIGRYASLGFNFKNNEWRFISLNPDNLSTLSYDENWSCLRLWKFLEHKKKLYVEDIRIVPDFDNFLTYAFWKKTDFFFFNFDVPYPQINMVNIGFDFSLPLRKAIKEKVDKHSIYIPHLKTYLDFCRFGQNPYFKYDYKLPVYASESMAMKQVLFGAVEVDEITWSIAFDSDNSIAPRRIQYKLWESTLNWLHNIALLAKENNDLNFPENVHITLSTGKKFDWKHKPQKKEEIETKVDISGSQIDVELGTDVFVLFMQPQNNAERKIVSNLIEAMLFAAGNKPNESELEDILKQIIPSDFSRYIHMYEPSSPVDSFRLLDDSNKQRLVQKEDLARNLLGLAWEFSDFTEKYEIDDLNTCLDFLRDGVSYMWSKIKAQIKDYNKSDLIKASLQQIEALAAENQHWKNTSRSLLELSRDREELYKKARKMQHERDQSSLCYRVLIEISNCECSSSSQEVLTQSVVDDIIAKVSILLELSSSREAISYEMSPPKVRLNSNGTISTEDENLELILHNFSKAIHEVSFDYAVSTYEELYNKEGSSKSLEDLYGKDVIEAFRCEYGISLESFLNVMSELYGYALDKESPVISINLSEFKKLMFDKAGLDRGKVSVAVKWDQTTFVSDNSRLFGW